MGLLGNGHRIERHFTVWLPELRGASVYILVDACLHANSSAMSGLSRVAALSDLLPSVRLECFADHDKIPLSTPYGKRGESFLALPLLSEAPLPFSSPYFLRLILFLSHLVKLIPPHPSPSHHVPSRHISSHPIPSTPFIPDRRICRSFQFALGQDGHPPPLTAKRVPTQTVVSSG
jgi:hypothetical protein